MERPPLFRKYIQNNKIQVGDQLLLEDDELDEIAVGIVSAVKLEPRLAIQVTYNGQDFISEKQFCERALSEAPKSKVTGGYYSHLFVIPAGVCYRSYNFDNLFFVLLILFQLGACEDQFTILHRAVSNKNRRAAWNSSGKDQRICWAEELRERDESKHQSLVPRA